MPGIYSSMIDAIGATPLISLSHIVENHGCAAHILAKCERFNPAGSIKDRAALGMIRDAEKRGRLKPGGLIIEPTSGNTGIGLAAIAAVLGYRCCIVMPDSMSVERIKLIRAYGAEIILTPGALGMAGCIEKAQQLLAENPGGIIAGQFENLANRQAHYAATGPEIWQDADGKVDIFVSAVGTGGTISGAGRYLKEQNPALRVVAVEPESSPLLSQGKAGSHKIQGIGANFVPEVLDREVYDEVMCVSDEDAFLFMRELARTEGLLCGISSGAALCAAVILAQREENAGNNIVVVLPDSGERYLSVM